MEKNKNMKISRDQMMQRYKSLPTDLQDAVFSTENSQTLQNIGQIHKLRVDQTGVLADETGLVMLGFTKPNEFIPHLTERLKIDKELARIIAHEVNDRIFIKVREALRKIHGIKSEIEEKTELPKIGAETTWKITDTIKPQPVLAVEDEGKRVNFYEDGIKGEKQLESKSEGMSQVAKTLERKPEVFKPAEEFPKKEVVPPPADLPKAPEPPKSIFSERMNKESFRSPAEVVEKTETNQQISKYASDTDPYREPLE